MYIYLLYNLETEKGYVGQTQKSVNYRWKQHIRASQNLNLKASRSAIGAAIRKYGRDMFEISILNDSCQSKVELNNCERLWIRVLQTDNPEFGYNLGLGGEGVTISPAVIQKMRNAKLGKKRNLTATQRQKIADRMKGNTYGVGRPSWSKGRHLSEDTKQKLRDASTGNKNSLGVKHSDLSRQHMSEAHKGQIPWNKGLRHV
jgi:group I intron endonuclease